MSKSRIETTISAYNRHARKYADKFIDYEAYKEEILRFQKNYLPAGMSILDIGCGPGYNEKILMDQDASYLFAGLDLLQRLPTDCLMHYDIVQTSQRMKCQNLPPSEYDACIEKTSATYDQYEKDREEVIHK